MLDLILIEQVIDNPTSFNDDVFCQNVLRRLGRDITDFLPEIRLDLWRFLALYRLKEDYAPYNDDVTAIVEIRLDDLALNKLQACGCTVEFLVGAEVGWDGMAERYWAFGNC